MRGSYKNIHMNTQNSIKTVGKVIITVECHLISLTYLSYQENNIKSSQFRCDVLQHIHQVLKHVWETTPKIKTFLAVFSIFFFTNVPFSDSRICNQHSRYSDAGLSDNLWAQVFSWQFEGSIQEP